MACATGEFYIPTECVGIWRRTRLQEIGERESDNKPSIQCGGFWDKTL